MEQQIQGIQRPEVKKTFPGKQPKFEPYGLSTVSHNHPEIVVNDNDELKIQLKAANPTKVTANLINMVTEKSYKDCVFHQTEDDIICFHVSIPEPGFYKLQIYALPASEDSKTLYGVYNYLITCNNASHPVRCYPKLYATWNRGCYLTEPLYIGDSNLSDVNFNVKVPGAQDVALTLDGNWVHLSQLKPAEWGGSISLKEYKGRNVKLALNANFGGDKTKYSTLLDYML